ncbi:MAG TPA: pentapeptide repeat-containing protein, partial [Bryobacteraceae bacterium]|nr:pentapeptide repeat-containing protein [Bryobacteraceae bacterium]
GVEFRGADLRGATLVGARLDEADFRGADLRGANLSRGRFHVADFRGALLAGADLTGADTDGALFDSAPNPPKSEGDPLATLHQLLASMPPELRENFKRVEEVLEGEEPPEDWKPWLEPLVKLAEEKPSLEEVMAALQQALEKFRHAG